MKVLALDEIEHSHGTVHLIDDHDTWQRKKGTDIVLVPQPNEFDQNDPLNWSLSKRLAAFYSVLFLSGLCNFCITGLAPGFEQIAEEFHVGRAQLTYLITMCLLGEFVGCYSIGPLAPSLGKRPLWLFCAVMFFVCNIWAAASPSYPSLLLARFFASWASGGSEPLSVDTMNDLFFLHERGTQAGVQGTWLSLGSSLAPIVCGFLIQSKGWRWYHWLVTILAGVNVLLVVLLVPETRYHRSQHTPSANPDVSSPMPESKIDIKAAADNKFDNVENVESNHYEIRPVVPRKQRWQQLNPWSGVDTQVNLGAAFLRPWIVWCYPAVVWACLSFSIHVACVVILISLIPIYLGEAPYNFTIAQQGLVFVSPCVGNLIGAYCCGYLNDRLSRFSARHNNGVFEPEMRLPVVLIPALFAPAGCLMFGIGIANETHWIVPVIGVGLVGVTLTGIPSLAQPYLMDAYHPIALDILVAFNGFKNVASFGIAFAVIPWIERDGLIGVFIVLSVLVVVIDASILVILIFGKRLRERDSHLRILTF